MKIQTLEEAANKANGYNVYAKETKAPIFNEGFIAGAKWQEEQDKVTEKEQKCRFANEYADNVMAGMMKRAEDFLDEYEQKTE
jgi:hypothetical protein